MSQGFKDPLRIQQMLLATNNSALSKTEADFILLSAIQPIIQQQQDYICSLESELSSLLSQFQIVEKLSKDKETQFNKELDSIQDNYLKQKEKFEQMALDISSERHKLNVEKEDIQNLLKIYRESNETTETINKRLMTRIEEQDRVISHKDDAIKSLQDENMQLSRNFYDIKEQLENLMLQSEIINHKNGELKEENENIRGQVTSFEKSLYDKNQEITRITQQLFQVQSSYEELQMIKKNQMDEMQEEINLHKDRLHSCQLQLAKKEAEYDTLRQDKMMVVQELREAKSDCDQMAKMLQDTENRLTQLEDREKILKEEEERIKNQKKEVSIQSEKLRLLMESNERVQSKLDSQINQAKEELQKKVEKILERERKDMRAQEILREKEISELNTLNGELKSQNELIRMEVQSQKEEIKQLRKQIEKLSLERQLDFKTLQENYDKSKSEFESEVSDLTEQINEMVLKIKEYEYSIESRDQKIKFYEERSASFNIEIQKAKDDFNNIREKYNRIVREKENIVHQSQVKESQLQSKIEELTDYSESQLTRYGTWDQKWKQEQRESKNKTYEMLLQQERLTEKWKSELELSSKAYEEAIMKLKKENKLLRNEMAVFQARSAQDFLLHLQ